MMSMPALRGERGLTLIEMMVTVTVLVIILLFSAPLFTTWNANTRIRSAAEGLQNGVRLAQSAALSNNGSVTLRLTNDPKPTKDSDKDSEGMNWVLLNSAGDVVQVKGGESLTNVTMTAEAPDDFNGEIVFRNLGQNELPATAVFAFTATGAGSDVKPLKVIVTPGSRVRMCDSSRAAGDPQACDQ
jgi:type IV fimbrial biogenesis protein FimT